MLQINVFLVLIILTLYLNLHLIVLFLQIVDKQSMVIQLMQQQAELVVNVKAMNMQILQLENVHPVILHVKLVMVDQAVIACLATLTI